MSLSRGVVRLPSAGAPLGAVRIGAAVWGVALNPRPVDTPAEHALGAEHLTGLGPER